MRAAFKDPLPLAGEVARRSRSEPGSEREVSLEQGETSPIVSRLATLAELTLPPQAGEGLERAAR
jgi:hypothetical protein